MKSKIIDLRTPYSSMTFKRSSQEQIVLRQKIIRYAQQKGNRPAAAHFGCDVRTVRTWRRRFEERGARALANKSRSPHRCPHKLSKEVEELIVEKRIAAKCYGPKRLKYFNPSIQVSEGSIYRVLKERGFYVNRGKNIK